MLAVPSWSASKRFTLVIDAGHGGKDTGALGAISKEKDINLKVALAFGSLIERNCPDVNVIYTRKTDVFIPLKERASIANRNKADLFISVHTNALEGGKIARGFETYTLGMHRAADNLDVAKRENAVILVEDNYRQAYGGFDPNSSESYIMFEFIQGQNMAKSVELARAIQTSVCTEAGRADKGVRQAGFLVLRETSMPSCLIELGFITTPDEERALNNENTVSTMAGAIYHAFLQYKSKNDKTIVVPYRTTEETALQTETKVKEAPVEPQRVESGKSRQEVSDGGHDDAPVFKIQILTSSTVLKKGDKKLKGMSDVDYYRDGGLYKYTYGSSANYNEIYRLRKQVVDKFPEAFIIAFKNGQRTDINVAIKEFKAKR